MPEDLNISVSSVVSVSDISTVRVGLRSYFSSWMLRSANRFALIADSIEQASTNGPKSPVAVREEHLDYIISSILCSYGFVEALVNEIFQDAYDLHGLVGGGYLAPLGASIHSKMQEFWAEEGTRKDGPKWTSTIQKYQRLLGYVGQYFEASDETLCTFEDLRRLRNCIVHYKPETLFGDEEHDLSIKLKKYNFPDSRLAVGGAWWPNLALGSGCAKWAHQTARSFADEAMSRLNIYPNYLQLDA